MTGRYAIKTEVSPAKSRADIEATLKRYGCAAFAFAEEPGKTSIAFRAHDRNIRFSVVPHPKMSQQAIRSMWRTLLLCIKAKLEAVEAGVSTFESEFLANVVMPDGRTVYETTRETIRNHYVGGSNGLPLLPPPEPRT